MWTKRDSVGSVVVASAVHYLDPSVLAPVDWLDCHYLLALSRDVAEGVYRPVGWMIGWNVYEVGGQVEAHAHCHLSLRYSHERTAGRGIRWWVTRQASPERGSSVLPES